MHMDREVKRACDLLTKEHVQGAVRGGTVKAWDVMTGEELWLLGGDDEV
jgi:hypothetical protein